MELPAQPRATGGPIHLLVDSSGLKLGGPGEWLVEKHGTSKRRSWRKLHIGFDAVTGRIVASILTDRDVDDASQVEPLLDQIAEPVELFMGDGGYDRTGVYTALDERHPDVTVVVPPRADAVLSATADTEPTQRDCHIQTIAGKGRMAWQRDSGYNQRLILDSRVLTEEPRGATIGPMSDSRSYLPSKGFGCCDGKHLPSAGTNHGFAADDQSDLLDR